MEAAGIGLTLSEEHPAVAYVDLPAIEGPGIRILCTVHSDGGFCRPVHNGAAVPIPEREPIEVHATVQPTLPGVSVHRVN